MRISWSPHQSSLSPAQPAEYLLADSVMRGAGSARRVEVRDPIPELLIGHAAVFQSSISALRFKNSYRVVTLSFAEGDIDVDQFNAGLGPDRLDALAALHFVIETAFAGIPVRSRPPLLACTHTHLGRLEINLAIPRFVRSPGGKIRSYNPNPPRSSGGRIWLAAENLLNERFGWADPRNPSEAPTVSGPGWLERQHRSALRAGQEPTMDAPRLFALDTAKGLAGRIGRTSALNYAMNLISELVDSGFRIAKISQGRVAIVGPLEDRPLILSGSSLRSPRPTSSLNCKADGAYLRLWQNVARGNCDTFGFDRGEPVMPDIDRLRVHHERRVPTHHPS